MAVVRSGDAPISETPNGVMRTLASPSRDGSAIAVWDVTLQPGARGPEHRIHVDQVYVVLFGTLAVSVDGIDETAASGDSVVIPGGTLRRIANAGEGPVTAVVSMPAGGQVSTPSGSHSGELPWAR